MWLKNATLIDCPNSLSICATNKNEYIPVKEGEQYFFKIYGIKNNYGAVPVLFLDENDNYIQDFFTGSYTKSKEGVELTVPFGAKKMHITNTQSLMIQKIINMTDSEIDKLCIDEKNMMEKINNSYMEYAKNPVVYKKINKAYISFVIEGTMPEDEIFINLFIEKGIPLSLATVPDLLMENSKSGKKTRLDIIKKLIETGKGEILSFNERNVLTEEKLGNYNEMFNTFIKTKQMFNFYGIEVNGVILARGNGQIISNETEEKWASSFFAYSDLYGLPPKYSGICIDSVYFHSRRSLFNYENIEKMKEAIDKDIKDKAYHILYFNSANVNDTIDTISQLLDYVKQKEKEGKLNIGNYKEFYEKNAIRMNDLIANKNTYYVSTNGNSEGGLSEKNPMDYETLKSMTFKSGDKILFKRGDIFYGSFELWHVIVDNSITTLSAYGDTKKGRPILSAYKIVNKKESWEKESDNIYKIDLTNVTKFSGVKDITPDSTKVGFMEIKNKTKYYNLKANLLELTQPYDFCSDDRYLFVRTNGATPFEELGELKLASKIKILVIDSNVKIENLHLLGTGYHGIRGKKINENVEIVGNVIENIGGSFLEENERYGNGINFFETEVKNVKIHKNIIRNVYDVAFTIQGNQGCGTNVTLTKNIFCLNSQDSEIWETHAATGVYNYFFEDNISFMQGRGWGYLARKDKYCASHILFWGYNFDDNVTQKTDIYFRHNYVYNPRRIYYITTQKNTDILFQKENCIKSDFNHYYMNNDSFVYNNIYDFSSRNDFILDYNKDKNSEFIFLDKIDPKLVDKIENSLDYNELRKIFFNEEEKEDKNKKSNSHVILIIIIVILLIGMAFGGILIYGYIRKTKHENIEDKVNNFPLI